jgi:glyoxylase-like metal-dependent hydrolase (beta-lactamase superfamily II)
MDGMEPIRIELPTGLGVGPVNAYLFDRPEVVLVDAGIKREECWQALVAALAERGLTPADISRVVITHAHVDHYGLAARLAAETDARIWVSDLGAPWLRETAAMWDRRLVYYRDDFLVHLGLPDDAVERTLTGMAALAHLADPVPPDRLVTFKLDGVLQMGGLPWRVIHTPGHASMQTCFDQAETRQLLSADMLLAIAPTPVVEQPPAGQTTRVPALPQFLESLARLEALDIDHVYPGHGRPFGDPHKIIARQRERIHSRQAECLGYIREGMSAVPDLLDAMYAHQPGPYRTVGLWMLIGYLDLLLADGLIRQEDRRGIWHYVAE